MTCRRTMHPPTRSRTRSMMSISGTPLADVQGLPFLGTPAKRHATAPKFYANPMTYTLKVDVVGSLIIHTFD